MTAVRRLAAIHPCSMSVICLKYIVQFRPAVAFSFVVVIYSFLCRCLIPSSSSCSNARPLYLEAKAGHACPVLVDCRLAVGGRVGRLGEEHALVALRLFLCANAAGLAEVSQCRPGRKTDCSCCQPVGCFVVERTLGFVAASLVAMVGCEAAWGAVVGNVSVLCSESWNRRIGRGPSLKLAMGLTTARRFL